MSFAPKTTVRCDVYWLMPDGTHRVIAQDVDQFEAEDYAFHQKKPEGARFICKIRR